MEREVILVDLLDREVGSCKKMKAHEDVLLHRAFSVFLYHGEYMLIQQRAKHKYHCGGLWTNSCCSHPQPSQTTKEAAIQRLKEEINVTCEVEEIFEFSYYYHFDNGLCEYEYDHVFIGEYEGEFMLDKEEVEDAKWISFDELLEDVKVNPQQYTPWFIIALPKVINAIRNK